MRRTAEQRNRDLIARVNAFMRPVELDYEKDVLPLTPKGNATERHICEAYERKAAKMFPDPRSAPKFWQEKLGDCPGRERQVAGADPRQDDETRRRRLRAAGQGIVPADGRHEPVRPGSGRDPDVDVARRHVRRREVHRGTFPGGDGVRRGGAEHHPRPQLHARA